MSEESDIFRCRQCGECCRGETTVSLDKEDLARMCNYLRLPEPEVIDKYLRVRGNVVQMKTVDGHCIFYREGCTIHPGKPWRCGQWPLHPSMLTDRANFEAIKTSCPGIRTDIDYRDFCRILAQITGAK